MPSREIDARSNCKRRNTAAPLRMIVFNHHLLREEGINIVKIAHHYTTEKYGVSIRDYFNSQ